MTEATKAVDAPANADDLRLRGNHEFAEGNFESATALYTAALEVCHSSPLLWLNRAACHFQMQSYESSVEDATKAWSLDKNSYAAAWRLIQSYYGLRKWTECKEWIQTALRLLNAEDENENESGDPKQEERTKRRTLLEEWWKKVLDSTKEPPLALETTILGITHRPISIREFKILEELGVGNFSEILVARHKVTQECFALKKIPKKRCEELAKRQHPNVYNEVAMEQRVLAANRLPRHANVVQLYHVFEDYNTVYYLQELHNQWSDLWSELRETVTNESGSGVSPGDHQLFSTRGVMVGCHRSCAVVWMYQLIAAIEHLHRHGIVHRDLKPENVLLNRLGHVVVIDFGTAKDLTVNTDLNGPEFVGTPDFMPPEAVQGTSGLQEARDAVARGEFGATPAADLWALGCLLYILQTGMTPFWNTSPYLAFLRIKRGVLFRPAGVVDDEAWELIDNLIQVEPEDRLGSHVFTVDRQAHPLRMQEKVGGYDVLRSHPYFATYHQGSDATKERTPIPSLRDLCIRRVADMVVQDARDLDADEDENDSACDSAKRKRHDLSRVSERDRQAIYHVLDRRRKLGDARVLEKLLSGDVVSSRVDRVRPKSHDVTGFTQMNDDQGKAPHQQQANADPYAKPITPESLTIVQLTNPLFSDGVPEADDDAALKQNIKGLKRSIAVVNRQRPKMVVVSSKVALSTKVRKLLARINDSIPLVVHQPRDGTDGTTFFTAWVAGIQLIALPTEETDDMRDAKMETWLRQHLEQARLSKHPVFVFVNGDPDTLNQFRQKQLARGRTLAIIGLAANNEGCVKEVVYSPNETVDDASIKSTDSEEDEGDAFVSKVYSTTKSGLRWITVDPEPDSWETKWDAVEL